VFTMMTIIRKRPEVTTESFRRFMSEEYGRTYADLPQTRRYVQYFLDDQARDGAEDPVDAIVEIAFDSREAMVEALRAPSYVAAHEARLAYMRDTSAGIHATVVEQVNTLVE
jgi:hypothetical protein